MDKTVFQLKCEYPKEYISNTHFWDLKAGTIEHKEHHYFEKFDKGRVYIDGQEINPKRAMRVRQNFCNTKCHFVWACRDCRTSITSLAICLHIFKKTDIALNMYVPFMEAYLVKIEYKSFEKTIDLTDFIIDHRERMTKDFITRYYQKGIWFRSEINIRKEKGKPNYYVDLFNQVLEELVKKKEEDVRRPMAPTAFVQSITGIKPVFDKEAVTIETEKKLKRHFVGIKKKLSNPFIAGIIEDVNENLSLYAQKLSDEASTRGKKHMAKYHKFSLKFDEKMKRLEMREKKNKSKK